MASRAKSIMNLIKTQITEKSTQDNEISTMINSNKRFFIKS
jgi:hypothetical protein